MWFRPDWNPGSQDYWSDVLSKGSLLRMSNSGHQLLDPRWKEPRFPKSPLEGTPFPRIPARRNPGSPLRSTPGPVPRTAPSPPGKWKTSDKENLPYFRIWKTLTCSNRLRPALGRLYKGNLNPKARDRHFETWGLELDG
ncbi:hypothetical protein F2Q69_00014125 [Brassica cretica]|uniref:Uncharacterized protein n=1 Tax=Brassica cretica TaxID=69181 RepID=A0A8S9R4V8_BRACR|nr:hypothetical protein F2Q69_00014125 [Brassica cretica]